MAHQRHGCCRARGRRGGRGGRGDRCRPPGPARRIPHASRHGRGDQHRPWGTQIHLVLAGLPRTGTFTAWTVGRDGGAPSIAATWSATPTGHADVTGATGLPTGGLTELRIATTDGKVLLTATS